jgi:broad specificity phosphatase PhoE
MSRRLILIKHAAPLVDPNKSSETWRLSEKGRASCGPLAEALRSYDLSVLVASEEPKAKETAEEVGRLLNVSAETAPGLHEHDRSNVPHMRSGEFISHVELMFRKPLERVLGRESAEEARQRFEKAVDAVMARHPSGNIGIVTHGTVIALFASDHSGNQGFALWREMGLPSFLVVSTDAGYTVEQVISHIAAAEEPVKPR